MGFQEVLNGFSWVLMGSQWVLMGSHGFSVGTQTVHFWVLRGSSGRHLPCARPVPCVPWPPSATQKLTRNHARNLKTEEAKRNETENAPPPRRSRRRDRRYDERVECLECIAEAPIREIRKLYTHLSTVTTFIAHRTPEGARSEVGRYCVP